MRDAQNANGGSSTSTPGFAPGRCQTRDSGGPVVAGPVVPDWRREGARDSSRRARAGSSRRAARRRRRLVKNIYITQPLGTPEAIARAVADAQVSLMRGQGVRLPYGT